MRDKRHTEFGGGPGWPQRLPDGTPKPKLTPAERRAITAMQMKRDLPSNTTPRTQTSTNGTGVVSTRPLPSDVARLKELKDRTNGYSAETGAGDAGTGETVG